ncbi:MAG: YceI family protein [Nitriliruptor sp.]|nr:MAG: YceI family protein [Nitriliruptor sp.]
MADHTTRTDETSGTSSPAGRSRRLWLLVVGLLVAGALALALNFYLERDTPAAVDTRAAVDAATDAEDAVGEEGSQATDPDEDAADDTEPGPLATDWVVDTDLVAFDFDDGAGTFLGFRIDEELTTVGATTAVGRTPEVEGTLSLDGSVLAEATVIGDLTALTTDIRQRDGRTQRAMNTDTHATATFELTEPVDLGTEPVPDDRLGVDATGELTLNGVTQPVTATIEGILLGAGDRLLVTGSFEVLLSDHDLVAPSAPIVVSVADAATVEFQLYLTPA